MQPQKQPETIRAARERLDREIDHLQSMDAMIQYTMQLLKLVVDYPPDNPEFYRRLKEMQQRQQKPLLDKTLLDVVTDN
jgi:hypothetical protein